MIRYLSTYVKNSAYYINRDKDVIQHYLSNTDYVRPQTIRNILYAIEHDYDRHISEKHRKEYQEKIGRKTHSSWLKPH